MRDLAARSRAMRAWKVLRDRLRNGQGREFVLSLLAQVWQTTVEEVCLALLTRGSRWWFSMQATHPRRFLTSSTFKIPITPEMAVTRQRTFGLAVVPARASRKASVTLETPRPTPLSSIDILRRYLELRRKVGWHGRRPWTGSNRSRHMCLAVCSSRPFGSPLRAPFFSLHCRWPSLSGNSSPRASRCVARTLVSRGLELTAHAPRCSSLFTPEAWVRPRETRSSGRTGPSTRSRSRPYSASCS